MCAVEGQRSPQEYVSLCGDHGQALLSGTFGGATTVMQLQL